MPRPVFQPARDDHRDKRPVAADLDPTFNIFFADEVPVGRAEFRPASPGLSQCG